MPSRQGTPPQRRRVWRLVVRIILGVRRPVKHRPIEPVCVNYNIGRSTARPVGNRRAYRTRAPPRYRRERLRARWIHSRSAPERMGVTRSGSIQQPVTKGSGRSSRRSERPVLRVILVVSSSSRGWRATLIPGCRAGVAEEPSHSSRSRVSINTLDLRPRAAIGDRWDRTDAGGSLVVEAVRAVTSKKESTTR